MSESDAPGEAPAPRKSTLLELHAKLMRVDADALDLQAAFSADEGCSWWTVDLINNAISPVRTPDPDSRVSVLIRRRVARMTRWKPFLLELGVPISSDSPSDTESVLVVIRTATEPARTVIWCFGTASLAVPNELIDGRFGLIAALNKHTADPEIASWRHLPDASSRRNVARDPATQVRRLDATVRDGYRHSVVAKGVVATPVDGLGFDQVSDLLRGVIIRTEDELMPEIEGSRGLKFSTFLDNWSDFAVLADHLVDLRSRDSYEKEWEWIDHVVPVAPRAEVTRLLGELARVVMRREDANIDIVLPDLEGLGVASNISFKIGREAIWHRPVDWSNIRRRLIQAASDLEPNLQRRIRIKALQDDDSEAIEVPISDILTAEFQEAGKEYVLSDGELLVVEADFLERLDAAVMEVPWSNFPFPSYLGDTEPKYLEDAPRRSNDRLILLDDRPIKLPGEHPFEACDLFSDDGRLIFGKLKGASSLFSHLCTQAETAAEMFLRSAAARDALLERISDRARSAAVEDAALDVMSALEDRRPGGVIITLLLLGPWRQRALNTLPLVSRMRLQRAARRMKALGYVFEVAAR